MTVRSDHPRPQPATGPSSYLLRGRRPVLPESLPVHGCVTIGAGQSVAAPVLGSTREGAGRRPWVLSRRYELARKTRWEDTPARVVFAHGEGERRTEYPQTRFGRSILGRLTTGSSVSMAETAPGSTGCLRRAWTREDRFWYHGRWVGSPRSGEGRMGILGPRDR